MLFLICNRFKTISYFYYFFLILNSISQHNTSLVSDVVLRDSSVAYMICLNIPSVLGFCQPYFSFLPSCNESERTRPGRVCGLVRAPMWLVVMNDSGHGYPPSAEGPCLVHTITGDLLRALEGPENCLFPRLISVSSEGHCIIYYERGRFSNFSINGKLLAQMEINDSTRVSLHVQG